ncbi:hypothetical protein [Salmonella phage PS3-1]|nr:hypothetical protein [Salmonella phage PS3-1]
MEIMITSSIFVRILVILMTIFAPQEIGVLR